MRRTTTRLVITGLMAASLPLGMLATAAGAQASPGSLHFHLVAGSAHARFLGERKLPGGDYTAAWRVYGETVRVAGPSGSTVTVPRPARNHAMATIRPPASLHKHSLAALAEAYARSGKSIAQDAMAVGYSAAQARKLARQAAGTHARTAYSPGQIIETPCASVSGDSNNAYGRACDVQKMVQDNGGGNWIVGDETTSSGNDTGPFRWNTLESLTAYVNYGANNTIVQWKPGSSVPEGNCSTVSLSLSYDNVGLSDSETVCPDREDPYGTGTANKFGAQWSGCDTSNYVEGADSVDVDNNPSNASVWPGVTVGISWGYCF